MSALARAAALQIAADHGVQPPSPPAPQTDADDVSPFENVTTWAVAVAAVALAWCRATLTHHQLRASLQDLLEQIAWFTEQAGDSLDLEVVEIALGTAFSELTMTGPTDEPIEVGDDDRRTIDEAVSAALADWPVGALSIELVEGRLVGFLERLWAADRVELLTLGVACRALVEAFRHRAWGASS